MHFSPANDTSENPPTPAYSQSLGGEAPGTPQGEAVGQAQQSPSKPFSAAGRPVAASVWPVRSLPPLFLWASKGDVRHFGPPSNGRPVAASLWPVRSLPPLCLWASKGDVRHFGPPSNPSRQPAGLLRPLCGLSEASLLSSYGLPKATLGILDRLQTSLDSRQACCGLSSGSADFG